MSGDVFALGRLGKLPYIGEADAALCRRRGKPRECASRRRRTGIVGNPIRNLSCPSTLPDVFCGDHLLLVRRYLPGAIDSGTESRSHNAIHPGIDVCLLLRQHSSTLLLIKKDDGLGGKALPTRRSCSGGSIRLSQLLGPGDGFQLSIETPVEQNQKAEPVRLHGSPVSSPCIRRRSGRVVQPISGIRKGLPEDFQIGVAGVFVAIEAEIGGVLPG